MSLLAVEEALRRVLGAVTEPVEPEDLPLAECAGRTLAADVPALRTQPPFPASAMDGYAVRSADLSRLPATLRIVGSSIAGRGFAGELRAGEAARIFTGAPVPCGADAIVIQEDAEAAGDAVTIREAARQGQFIRPPGLDFEAGANLLFSGQRVGPRRLALAAAMGHASLRVRRRPRVAILATGDELRRPGEPLGPDQIVASNIYAIASVAAEAGAEAIDLGIARDSLEDIRRAFDQARDARADLLVTVGGASVGEHDLVREALHSRGMELGFWRIAMRPGKPLMHGRLGSMLFLGLPGNPVSSIVCTVLFVVPAIRALVGDPDAGREASEPAILGCDLPENDRRQDYLRARLQADGDGLPVATAFDRQDSSMLRLFCAADALILRQPHAPPARAGDRCRVIRLDRVA